MLVYKDMGLVSQVFDEAILESLVGHLAVGHCRYSTTGASVWANAQPTFRSTGAGGLALAHNGNLTNSADLVELAAKRAADADLAESPGDRSSTNDTGLITRLLATYPDRPLLDAAQAVCAELRGAFSLVFMDEDTLYAARDPQGIRPLVIGRLGAGWWWPARTPRWTSWVRSSFARWSRARWSRWTATAYAAAGSRPPSPKGCLFEFVYLSAPTPGSPVVRCTRPGSRSVAGWRATSPSRPTW